MLSVYCYKCTKCYRTQVEEDLPPDEVKCECGAMMECIKIERKR